MAEGDAAAKVAGLSKEVLVADYKRLLQGYIDRRPSGMRLKIAEAIGKHKSFVSQITNPAYPVPVPAPHLEAIFKICHFSPEERRTFLKAYGAAHPIQSKGLKQPTKRGAAKRSLEIPLPAFDDPALQEEVERLIRDFAERVIELARR